MRQALLMSAILLVAASVAFAQPGYFGIFSDEEGVNCAIWDISSGLGVVHIVYLAHGGTRAASFAAPLPPCAATWIHLGTVPPPNYSAIIGDPLYGFDVGFASCMPAPTLLATMNFLTSGLTPSCCYYPVLPHPDLGARTAMDCLFNSVEPGELPGVINQTAGCYCALPAGRTTWGHIKGLYE